MLPNSKRYVSINLINLNPTPKYSKLKLFITYNLRFVILKEKIIHCSQNSLTQYNKVDYKENRIAIIF